MNEKKNTSVYLDNLEFDESLNKKWYSFFIDRTRFTWLVIIIILVTGLVGLRSLPLESTPEVDIGIAFVATTFPGASPETMEDLITKKLEKEIGKIDGIDSIESTSMKSMSLIIVRFLTNADIKDGMRDLREKVSGARSEMPKDSNESIVREISLDESPVWVFSVSGDYSGFELYDYGKNIAEEIEKNALVSEVKVSGGEEKEFGVLIDPKKLEQYGVSLSGINDTIKSINTTVPTGDISVGEYKHNINVDSRFYDIAKLKNIIIKKTGDTGLVYLKDVADVKEIPKKITSISRLSIGGKEPLNAVSLSVIKKRGGSIIDLLKEGEEIIEKMRVNGDIPDDLYITTTVDNGEMIKDDLNHLIRDGIITIFLVFISLLAIIGVREAIIASSTVPIVFLMTFTIMAIFGQTLNFLSMFSLILSLGLLVDDAIVIISAINQYKKTGKFTTREAALLVIHDYKQVLLTTTLTVVFIFGSMLFMTGIIGKFMFSIPFVICVTLIASLFIALTINPALAVMVSGKDKKYHPEDDDKSTFKGKIKYAFNYGLISMNKLEAKYGNIMNKLFDKKRRIWTLFLAVFCLFVTALYLPISGILRSDFFPKTDSDTFTIDIEAESGTKLDSTSQIVKQVEEILFKEKEIKNFSTNIGTLSSSLGGASDGESYAYVTVSLVKEEDGRKEASLNITNRLRNGFSKINDAKITIKEETGGPPVGADFEINIAGEDFIILEKIANDLVNIVNTIPGALDISTSRKTQPFEFNLALDETKLALYDITVPQVAIFLRNVIDGVEATKIYKGDDEIIVRTKFSSDSVDTLDKIKDLQINNNKGVSITMRDIMTPEFKASVFSIERIDQDRVITVSANASSVTNGTLIQKEFQEKMANYKLPTGYKFVTGGMNEQSAKSVASLMTSMLFGMMLIIAILILLYNSYIEAFLVLVTIPLSMIGVFFGLTLFGQPLSFPGLVGMVALFGIVVRNGIILFDKINQNLDEGISFKESIVDAGMTRLEPVMLTSICTVLGMIPLTLSNPMWTSLGLSIICGLSVSTIFTLVVLPSLYYIVFRRKYLKLEANIN